MSTVSTRYWVIAGLILAALLVVFAAYLGSFGAANPYRWHIAVVTFGLAVGASELVGRYRDAPFITLWTWAAGFYAAMNAAAALVAFVLIRRFKINFGYADNDPNLMLIQAMVAGFGSMAFFRSSLFTIKVDSSDVPVGPGIFFQVLLFAADRACDRQRAWRRSGLVTSIMNGVSFSAARDTLPNFCFELMQNLSSAEAARVRQAVDGLASSPNMRDADKALSLGLMLMNVVGSVVLETAVRRLGPRLQEPAKIELSVFNKLQDVDFAKAFPVLVEVCAVMSKFGTQVEQQEIRKQVLDEINRFAGNAGLDNETKVVMLALSLQQRFGDAILEAALTQLGNSIKRSAAAPPPPP